MMLLVRREEATVREIANQEVTLTDVPGPNVDWDTIAEFALTFDGYKAWGSFEKCAEIANAQRQETLTQVRTCLFFEQRRWRHFGEEPDKDAMEYIRGVVEKIRSRVAAADVG